MIFGHLRFRMKIYPVSLRLTQHKTANSPSTKTYFNPYKMARIKTSMKIMENKNGYQWGTSSNVLQKWIS